MLPFFHLISSEFLHLFPCFCAVFFSETIQKHNEKKKNIKWKQTEWINIIMLRTNECTYERQTNCTCGLWTILYAYKNRKSPLFPLVPCDKTTTGTDALTYTDTTSSIIHLNKRNIHNNKGKYLLVKSLLARSYKYFTYFFFLLSSRPFFLPDYIPES